MDIIINETSLLSQENLTSMKNNSFSSYPAPKDFVEAFNKNFSPNDQTGIYSSISTFGDSLDGDLYSVNIENSSEKNSSTHSKTNTLDSNQTTQKSQKNIIYYV